MGSDLWGWFASLFGGSSTLISEPTGPMTVIMTAVLTAMMSRYPEGGLAMGFTVVMMAGAFQVLIGSLRLGKYVTLMPYSVVSGFMSGIGVILILLQLAPLLGQATPSGGVLGTLTAIPDLVINADIKEVFLGVLTLGILFYFPAKYRRFIPAQLVALVSITLVSVLLFDVESIRRIGEIPTGLPSLVVPHITAEHLTTMVIDALVLGTLGCIDTLLTAVIADSLTRQEHNSDRELRGQGVANMIAGLFGALPGAGATMGTVVNVQVGARSPLSGIFRAAILAAVVLVAGAFTAPIPMAVLAGIALYVGFNILDWSFLHRAHKISLQQTGIMYGVMALTVFVDLIVAVGLGVFIANLLVIERLSREQAKQVRAISDAEDDEVPLNDEERALLDASNGHVLFFYLSGPMIFSVSKAIARQHAHISEFRVMILDLSDVPMLDMTVGLALENAIKDAREANCTVFLLCPHDETREQLQRLHIGDWVRDAHIFTSRKPALEAANRLVEVMPA
jgi:Sulfate permease and related transporters (MFS superfamily)